MNIIQKSINDLISAEYNPRQLSKAQYKQIKDSISRFGLVDPIIINKNKERKNIIVGGHQRVKVATDLDYKEVPCVEVDLTYDKERELNIRLNKNTGEWDYDVLADLFDMEELTDWGFTDEELVGFAPEEVKVGFTDDDAIPEEVEPVCKSGQLYQLGEHRLYCGDATIKADVEALMGGEKAELLHADPPYGMGKEKDGILNDNLYEEKLDKFQMKWWKIFRPYIKDNGSAYIWGNAKDLWRLWYLGGMKNSERLTFRNEIVWDKQGEGNPTLRVCGSTFKSDRSFTQSERCFFFMLGEQGFNNNADNYWEGWESIRSYLDKERIKSGWKISDIIEITGKTSASHYFTTSQWMFPTEKHYKAIQEASKKNTFKKDYDTFKKDYDTLKKEFYSTRASFNSTHDTMTDVWQFDRVQGEERHGHATPKPIAIMERIIKSSSEKSVIEPFLGSGSTMIACEKTNRKCYGMELDPHYCDVIIKRWEDYTGQKAELIGKT